MKFQSEYSFVRGADDIQVFIITRISLHLS